MKNFFNKSDEERKQYYVKNYKNLRKSWGEVADSLGTYPNKVRRDATKLGVHSRDKAEAQKVAIEEGRHEHPTRGKQQSEETKRKISESQGQVWDSLTEEEREYRSQIGTEAWNNKSEKEKAVFFQKSLQAIQEASRHGSKIEKYLASFLRDEGYRVEAHKEHVLQNEKFHIDLYVPSCRVAIEVDGPMHFEPLFGEEKLQRRQAADMQKNGLILSAGMVLIRVKLTKRESQRYLRRITSKILEAIKRIEKEFPSEHERYIEV